MIKQEEPVKHSIRMWSNEMDAKLQDCFSSTDWNMFRDSSDGIAEIITSAIGFINNCIDKVVLTVTICTFPNQKPWIKGIIHSKLKARAATSKEHYTNLDAYKKSHYDLCTIKQAKHQYRTKIKSFKLTFVRCGGLANYHGLQK
jgi:hypothetical protein